MNINTNASQLQRERQVLINKVLDETRDNIKKTANEAKKDISTYAEQFTTLQERAIDTARDIVEEYIELQREIINSFNQFIWAPYLENVENRTTTAVPEVFSLQRTEAYTNTIKIVQIYSSTLADNYITTTRLANKAVFTHAELINTSLQQVGNNAREYSRMGINAAKNFHEAANEAVKIGLCSTAANNSINTKRPK